MKDLKQCRIEIDAIDQQLMEYNDNCMVVYYGESVFRYVVVKV